MTRLLPHAVILKIKKSMHCCIHLLLFFYFELYLNACSKEIYSFICYYKEEKEVCSKYFLFKILCSFSRTICQKNVLVITKLNYCFALDKANGLGKVYSSRNKNKNNIEKFQGNEVLFSVGILLHLSELEEADRVIQNLKKEKVK